MSDVKDILGVPRGGAPTEKQDKPKEQKLVKPKGMSREAFALLSASHPLVPSDLVQELGKKSDKKNKPKKRGQVTFQWQAFKNPARSDGLELSHWVKCYKDANNNITPADQGEYPFAKYNKKAKVYRYNEEEWNQLITADPEWSLEETNYLIDLVEAFDLKWLVIADRYEFPDGKERSIEDIKARYYSVARQLVVGREGNSDTIANNILVKHPFNAQHEKERKEGLELLMKRSHEEDAKEEEILQEAVKIEAKRKAENAQRRGAAAAAAKDAIGTAAVAPVVVQITEFTNDAPIGTPPLFDAEANPVPIPPKADDPSAPAPNVVTRAAYTRELIESIIQGLQPGKNQKAVEGSMAELKMSELPRAATRAVCGAYLSLLKEVTEVMDLKRSLAARPSVKRGRASDEGDFAGAAAKRARIGGKKGYDEY